MLSLSYFNIKYLIKYGLQKVNINNYSVIINKKFFYENNKYISILIYSLSSFKS